MTRRPGRAALLSTFILLVTYVSVAIAVVAFAGTQWLSDNAGEEEFVFYYLADRGPRQLRLDPAALGVDRRDRVHPDHDPARPPAPACRWPGGGAIPPRIGHIHPRHRTPDVSTWTVAAIAIAWYVGMYQVSENALFDSLTALALLIAFYYALTGIACAVYYRKHLTESAKNFVLIGIGPLIGSALLIWLLVLSVRDQSDPDNSYSGQAWLGVGPPLVIGVGVFLRRHRRSCSSGGPRRSATGTRSRPCPIPTSCTASSRRARPRRTGRLRPMAVVLGYDESPGAEAALDAAIQVAQRYGEELVLVYGAAPAGRAWVRSASRTATR